jgi:transposase
MKIQINESEVYEIKIPETIDKASFLTFFERLNRVAKIIGKDELSELSKDENVFNSKVNMNSIVSQLKSSDGRLTEIGKKFVLEKLAEKMGPSKIANELKVDKSVIYYWKNKLGKDIKKKTTAWKLGLNKKTQSPITTKWTPEIKEFLEKYKNKLTNKELANALNEEFGTNVKDSNVAFALTHFKIKRKKK